MKKEMAAIGCLLAVSVSTAGCQEATRIAWAVETQGLGWRRSLAGSNGLEPEGLERAQGLAHYVTGLVAEGRGDFDQAQREYRQVLTHDPAGWLAQLRQGALLLRMNNIPEALGCFETASRLDPSDPRPHFLLGVLYASDGKFNEASREYAMVLSQDPSNLAALSHLADLYVAQEKVQEGLAVYEQLLRQRPDSAVAHFNVGMLYARVGQWGQAVSHFRQAVDLDPSEPSAHVALAASLEMTDDSAAAKEQFLEALKLEPANARLIHYVAQISYRMGELEEAAQWFNRYLSCTPRDPAGYLELGSLRLEQGRWQESVKILELALEFQNVEEPPVELLLALGLAYQYGKEYREAEKAFRQAALVAPEESRPSLYLGELFQASGRFDEAEEAYRSAFQLNPEDPEILNGLGYLYAERGIQLGQAELLVKGALAKEPQNGAYLDSLGWVYFKMGRTEEALQLLESAASRMPDPEVFDHLGQVYLFTGKVQEARAAWQKGVGLHSKDAEMIHRLQLKLKALEKSAPQRVGSGANRKKEK